MRARTIGQIATLINGHMGGAPVAAPVKTAPAESVVAADEVDVEALSDEDLDLLLGGEPEPAKR
jgi:hypothetical protein